MLIGYKRGQTSVILRVKILDSALATGAGKTGLTNASSGLIIAAIADNEVTSTVYSVASSNVETIATLGTWAAPTASKCRFKEVDAVNHKGIYEIQLANARFAVTQAKSLLVSISGASGAAECDVVIPLTDIDFYDAVRGGMTALPNANAEAAGGLYTRGSGPGQIVQQGDGEINARLNATSLAEVEAEILTGNLAQVFGANDVGLVLQKMRNLYGFAQASTTIATLASQTSFTLAAGSANNDAYNGCLIAITDGGTSWAFGVVSDYVGGTKTVTLLTDPAVYTMAVGNTVYLYADRSLKATVDNRTLDVSATGEAGVDWANVGSPAATVALTGTTLDYNRILDRVDYQRGHHAVAGSTFYVDGVGGNDANPGTRSSPVKTITAALVLCTANVHDEIILLPNSAGGPTTITETTTITITKNYVQIRGPGRDVNVTRSNNGTVFDIQANGVGLSGFRVTTFGGGSSDAINVNTAADFVRLERLWIESAHRDAVQFNVANRCEVIDCVIVVPARDGVRVSSGAGSGTHNVVTGCTIRDAVGSGVNLQGADASDCRIQRNVIRDNAVGVTIASGVADTVLTDNRFLNNATAISDAGTNTLQQWNFLNTDTDGVVLTDSVRLMKNTAFSNFHFVMRDTNGDPATGLTVTAERLIDAGAFAACANSVVEESAGLYRIDLATTDLNGECITFKFTAGGARATLITVITNIV